MAAALAVVAHPNRIEMRTCPRTACGGQLFYFSDDFGRPQFKCTLCSREAIHYPVDRSDPAQVEHDEARSKTRNQQVYAKLEHETLIAELIAS